MELSVVVSTLNDREQLQTCLDALAERAPRQTEIVVVNGPSSDGTTGIVRDRSDVDVLVEISERNRNVSRNAGLGVTTGDVVAFLDGQYVVEDGWYEAIERSIERDADVISGPVTGEERLDEDEPRPIPIDETGVDDAFDVDNAAFDRTVLTALDGFDEYLEVGGSWDCAQRVQSLGFEVRVADGMAVHAEFGADGGTAEPDWETTYRSLSYQLAKNNGPRPRVFARTAGNAIRDGLVGVRRVISGSVTPTDWFSDGVDVVTNIGAGFRDGIRARYADRSARRNPNGLSVRHDRAVRVYDRR
ncbi:glycosyltransferase family 2 protein [Natrialbaceae archaeon A-arb3/5]